MKGLAWMIGLSLPLWAFLFAGCTAMVPGKDVTPDNNVLNAVRYVHDDAHGVGCWVSYGVTGNMSIFCLPDTDYTR